MSSAFLRSVFAYTFAGLGLSSVTVSAVACGNGGVPTPPDVVKQYSVPAGKTACRYIGERVDVAGVKHPVNNINPGCDGEVISKDEDKKVSQAIQGLGATLAIYGPDGLTNLAGLAITGIGVAWPQHEQQTNANCRISKIVLRDNQTVFHYAAFYIRPGESWNKPHPFDKPSFNNWNAGEGDIMVSWIKPIPVGDGRTIYGILFRNWQEGDAGNKTVEVMVDAFE